MSERQGTSFFSPIFHDSIIEHMFVEIQGKNRKDQENISEYFVKKILQKQAADHSKQNANAHKMDYQNKKHTSIEIIYALIVKK